MLGADAQLRLNSGTTFRAGYTYMFVDLPPPATTTSFLRGGGYLEASQKFMKNWKASVMGGTSQNDNRVIDVSDQLVVGALIMYDFSLAQISAQFYHDFDQVPGKLNYDFGAIRLVVML